MEMTTVCPVCGEYTFDEIDNQETCPVCGWINDKFQTEHHFVCRGVNRFSLAQQKKAWRILNGELEVGYGVDNLGYGFDDDCKLCEDKICVDECKYKLEQLKQGKLPYGVTDLEKARNACVKCILRSHAVLEDMQKCSKMVDKPSGRDPYGNGGWGVGSDEYDLEYYQKMLKSLINYCHSEENIMGKRENEDLNPTYAEAKDWIMSMAASDETGRRNFYSYFSRPVLSVADFIEYATNEQGTLDHRFTLWNFGKLEVEDKYEFTKIEKKNADQVLHITLSFINYKCDSFSMPGLFYLDNCYEGWEVDEFNDTIAAWFADIGEELNEQYLKDFIEETLRESFAYSHVKLALHLMSHLDTAKSDPKLQKLLALYSRVPEMQALVKKCQ